jgi:hypothetical protein
LWLDEPMTDEDPRLTQLTAGVSHNGEQLYAKQVRILAHSEHATELELTLTQGKKRQIRHMCRTLDLHLVHLHRRQIGPLSDANLALGSWRLLSSAEVEALWKAVGGRDNLRERKVLALKRHATEAREAGAPHERLEAWLEREPSVPYRDPAGANS